MSYHSNGKFDDLLAFTGTTTISCGEILPEKKFKKFVVDGQRSTLDERKIDGNCKTTASDFMKLYAWGGGSSIKMGEVYAQVYNKTAPLSVLGISNRFQKWMKRFYIWVAHAYFKEYPEKIDKGNLRPGGMLHRNRLFFRNEERIVEWIHNLHTLKSEVVCQSCKDTGLVEAQSGPFLWDYCVCKHGKTRKKLIYTPTGWKNAKQEL